MTPNTLMNAMPTAILRTPVLHRLMSGRYLLLTFTGRTTGRQYRTPVAYRRTGARLVLSTDSPWWRNLEVEPAVSVLLRGRQQTGIARRVTDPAEAATELGRLVQEVPGYRRAAGLSSQSGGGVSDDELLRAVTAERKVFTVAVQS